MSTPLELAEEELRERAADLVIARRKQADANAEVEEAGRKFQQAQAAVIVELKKPKVRSHRRKETG